MKNKKFEIITFLLVFLGLFCFLYKFNNEMILTKENIELINQDKNLKLVFEMPNMFDIYVRAISESILKILLFISPLLVVIPTFKKKKITYNYAFILSLIFDAASIFLLNFSFILFSKGTCFDNIIS